MKIRELLNRNSLASAPIAFLVAFSVLAVGVIARTTADTPLDARSLSSLVEELKGVVSRTAPDQNEAAMVASKWNKRKDLAGKTRSKVIDMLFTDVRAVIKDSGTLYQLYSMFAFYKTIPDKPASSVAEKFKSKPAAVNRLVDLTFRMHPYVGIDEQLNLLPGSKATKTDLDEERSNRISGFEDALKVNNKLTSEQKAFVRENFDQLIKMTDKITEDAIRTNFPTESWIKEGLRKNYASKFTLAELTDLVSYLPGPAGQQTLRYNRISNMAQMITGNGGTLDLTDSDKAEYERFAAAPLGMKFMSAYMKDTIAYEQARENAVRSKNPNADGFAIYRPENLNKLFNKYVAANFKK
jgi:hypothetical protein